MTATEKPIEIPVIKPSPDTIELARELAITRWRKNLKELFPVCIFGEEESRILVLQNDLIPVRRKGVVLTQVQEKQVNLIGFGQKGECTALVARYQFNHLGNCRNFLVVHTPNKGIPNLGVLVNKSRKFVVLAPIFTRGIRFESQISDDPLAPRIDWSNFPEQRFDLTGHEGELSLVVGIS